MSGPAPANFPIVEVFQDETFKDAYGSRLIQIKKRVDVDMDNDKQKFSIPKEILEFGDH